MNLKKVVPLCAAGVLGLAAAIVASQLVRQRPVVIDGTSQQAMIELADVVVAARDLAPGQVIVADDLTVARFDARTAPLDAPRDATPLLGRVLRLQVPRGQVIHPASMLADRGVAGGLAAVVPAGMRAMTIEVNEFTGVAGLIEPGNRLDILARLKETDAQDAGSMTRTVAQDVEVLAVGQSLTNRQAVTEAAPGAAAAATKAEGDATLPASKIALATRSLTMLVTPEQAEQIDVAMGENPTMAVRMSLRSPNDRARTSVSGATLAALRGPATADGADAARLAGAKLPGATTPPIAEVRPGDDVFGNAKKPTFKAGPPTRSITVVRAGVATQVEVDEPLPPEAQPMSSAAE